MNILITAGPTREYFDTVRFISNPSTGLFGYEIARDAARRGHRVTLVSGPVELSPPAGVRIENVVTAAQMYDACLEAFTDANAAIMTAAVCDYRPARRLPRKLKKKDRSRTVRLVPTRDICAELGRIKSEQIVIGFAMEDYNHRAHAERKLRQKRCDAMVLNGISNIGPGRAKIEVLVAPNEWCGPFQGTKRTLASRIVDLADSLCR